MLEMKAKALAGLELLQKGDADQAMCQIVYDQKHELSVEKGKFTLYRTLFDTSATFTAICGGKRGTVQTNQLGDAYLQNSAKECLEVAQGAEADDCWQLAPSIGKQCFSEGALVYDEAKLYERIEELIATIKERFPTVVIADITAEHSDVHAYSVFSTGTEVETRKGSYLISVMFNAVEEGVSSSMNYTWFQTADLDKPFIEQASLCSSLDAITRQVKTEPYRGSDVGTMVLTPDVLSDFMSFTLGNFIGDTALIEGSSIWKDKLNKVVADERLTISLAPRDERIVCGQHITGEGYLVENYNCIENGVLKQFILSDYAARKTGFKRAPNVSANFIIANGDQSYDEIIRNVKKGILVARFSGGQPGLNGDFSGVAKNSFIIEDGKIGPALRETMLSGNLADMLMNIVAISQERVCNGTSVLPWIAFDGVTISGEAKEA